MRTSVRRSSDPRTERWKRITLRTSIIRTMTPASCARREVTNLYGAFERPVTKAIIARVASDTRILEGHLGTPKRSNSERREGVGLKYVDTHDDAKSCQVS
jgi:hypothetical protein